MKRLLGLKQFNFNNFHKYSEILYRFCVGERPACCKINCTPSDFENKINT